MDLHDDLLQLDSLHRRPGGGPCLRGHLAEAVLHRGQGDVDAAHVGPAGLLGARGVLVLGAARSLGTGLRRGNAHHTIVVAADLDVLSQGIVKAEQFLDQPLFDYADALLVLHVRDAEETPEPHPNGGDVGIPRHSADDLDGRPAVAVEHLLRQAAVRHDHLDVRDAVLEALGIIISQTILLHHLLASQDRPILRRRDGLDDDVVASELSDLLLCIHAGPLSDGQHGNDGGDAEDDAQGRQRGAQAVHPQVLDTQPDDAFETKEHHDKLPSIEFILGDSPIEQSDNPPGLGGDGFIMGHND